MTVGRSSYLDRKPRTVSFDVLSVHAVDVIEPSLFGRRDRVDMLVAGGLRDLPIESIDHPVRTMAVAKPPDLMIHMSTVF
jgi:hypothetical protein